MSQQHARAWWADVEHLREELEDRRGVRDAPARPSLRLVEPPRRRPEPDREERAAPSGRRTVLITGRPAEPPAVRRLVEVERRRPAAPVAERFSARPDRLAAWAVLLGLVLVLVALTSGA